MKTALRDMTAAASIDDIAFQPASVDIWDKKYRLKAKDGTVVDHAMDDTYKRIARALSEVEADEIRELWNEKFLCARLASSSSAPT